MKQLKVDGERVSYFISALAEEIGEEAAQSVLETARNIMAYAPELDSEEEKVLGLLYGLVQSGKTNIINATVALAADNEYKISVILTDRNNTLQDQTFDRAEEAMESMVVKNIAELTQEDPEFISTVLKYDGLVLVCKKDPADLVKLQGFLNEQDLSERPILIVDDEADAVGLDAKQRLEGEAHSTVNQHLRDIRELAESHLFLQVTATPQAIILQNREEGGFYPAFIEVVEAGSGYTGIDTFFNENKDEHIRKVDKTEIEKLADLETAGEDVTQLPEGLLNALSNFIVGAAIKLHEGNKRREEQRFSFLCHISPFKDIHSRLKLLTKKFVTDLYKALKNPEAIQTRDFVVGKISAAYEDLRKTNASIPEFAVVLKIISDNITNNEVIVLNSDPTSQRNIKLKKKFNFIIGGNKLSRGVTIPRLLVTYYGRFTGRSQVDTLMQHARMCGYRSKDLNVTRVFIPNEIVEKFIAISEHDAIQRDIIKNHGIEGTLYLDTNSVSPTRPNVIPKTVGAYKAGQATFPKLPVHDKDVIKPVTKFIDEKIKPIDKEREFLEMGIDTAIEIIDKIPVEVSGGWYKEVIIKYLSWYKKEYSQEKLQAVYTLGANIGRSKSRENRVIGSLLSASMQELVSEADIERPLFVLVRNKGNKWNNSNEDFWIPWFRFPDNGNNILFNLNNV